MRASALLVFASLTRAAAAQPAATEELAGPPLETAPSADAAALPAEPAFELPAVAAGQVPASELRLRPRRHLGAELRVVGYVTSREGCKPPPRRARRPPPCSGSRLTLGDAASDGRERSIVVLEVPGPPRKPRRGAPPVPALSVGERVEIVGIWGEHGDAGRAPEPALAYRQASPAPIETSAAASAGSAAVATAAPVAVTTAESTLAIAKPPPRLPVEAKARAASLASLSACTRAFSQGQHAAALTACRRATSEWRGNHMAWYVGASASMALGDWPTARAAMEYAVALRPDLAMYQLYHGVAIYEEALATARAARPAAAEVEHDTPALPLARDALRRAAHLAPALWRAHAYLARVYLDLGQERRAAAAFAATARAHPRYAFAYHGLVELYRRWGYLEEAAAVARAGLGKVAQSEAPELWFSLGVAEEERGREAEALESYGRALALRADHPHALLRRGQLHLRRGERERARLDLRAVASSPDPAAARLAPAAAQLLQALDKPAR